MRLLLAGGGTGGHLFPAVALAQRLLEEEWQAQVLFVGTAQGIETRVLPKLNLPLATIDISGFVGKSWGARLRLAPQLWRSVRQSMTILERFSPDVVVGVGGYAAGPVLLAAKLKGIPYVIHEQNAVFGLTNRLLARWAERVCVSFAMNEPGLPADRLVHTGNPVRREMAACPPLPDGNPVLLVFGGSRGATAINDAIVAALPLLAAPPGLRIHHQSGPADLERVRDAYLAAGRDPNLVVPFIDEMGAAYAESHLVVCRAGATTIAELTACGRPALLIPYPFAAADHQTSNARALTAQGAAVLLPQSELTPEKLAHVIQGLLTDRTALKQLAGNAKSLGQPQAVDRLLEQCRAVSRRS